MPSPVFHFLSLFNLLILSLFLLSTKLQAPWYGKLQIKHFMQQSLGNLICKKVLGDGA